MATRIATGVWRLPLRGVNAYLVADGDDLALVDAGTPWDDGRIREGVRDAGFALADVDRVLVTHYDLDHVGGLAGLASDLDAPVVAHDPDASYIDGTGSPPWNNHKGALQRVTSVVLDRPDLPVERVADGDERGSFVVHHTPGHTPGHVAYVSEALGVAFLGDLVRATDDGLAASPWFISYDTDLVEYSIHTLASRATEFDVACPGHGDPLTSGGFEALAALAD